MFRERNVNVFDAQFLDGDPQHIATFLYIQHLVSPSLVVEVEKDVTRHPRSTMKRSSIRTSRTSRLVLLPVTSLAIGGAVVRRREVQISLASHTSSRGRLTAKNAGLRRWHRRSHFRSPLHRVKSAKIRVREPLQIESKAKKEWAQQYLCADRELLSVDWRVQLERDGERA